MARAVLGFSAIALFLAGPAAANAAQAVHCSGGRASSAQVAIRKLEAQLKAGRFYIELVREYGNPVRCTAEPGENGLAVTFSFRGRALLTMRTDSKLESSEERVQVPQMEMAKAIALLKQAEKEAYQPGGCGIAWDQPEEESSGVPAGFRESIYRGDACNCQARIRSRGNVAVSLLLRSAC